MSKSISVGTRQIGLDDVRCHLTPNNYRDHWYVPLYVCSGNGYGAGMTHEAVVIGGRECPLCAALGRVRELEGVVGLMGELVSHSSSPNLDNAILEAGSKFDGHVTNGSHAEVMRVVREKYDLRR